MPVTGFFFLMVVFRQLPAYMAHLVSFEHALHLTANAPKRSSYPSSCCKDVVSKCLERGKVSAQ